MPFKLIKAPAAFQTRMNNVRREFLDNEVVIYPDDILIYSANLEDHIQLVQQVLDSLEQHNLAVSLKKLVFREEVEFLGDMIQTSGVTLSDRKVKSIRNCADPRRVKQQQILMGFRKPLLEP